jgi:hypothetical protein
MRGLVLGFGTELEIEIPPELGVGWGRNSPIRRSNRRSPELELEVMAGDGNGDGIGSRFRTREEG